MPYIKQEQRDKLDPFIDTLLRELKQVAPTDPMQAAGPTNYAITRLVMGVIKHTTGGELNYGVLALYSGVLMNVADEMYRRVAAEYEDKKAQQNGDLDEFTRAFNNAPTVVADARPELMPIEIGSGDDEMLSLKHLHTLTHTKR